MPYVRSSLGQRIRASFARSGFAYPSGPAKPPYLITEDAGTVAHVYFDGSKLVDSKGNAWAMQGTVPQVAKSGNVPPGAGPFSDSNYYSLGTGSDVLDFSGAFSGVLVVIPSSTPTPAETIIGNEDSNSPYHGWYVDQGAANTRFVLLGGSVQNASIGPLTVGVPNVIYFGRTSGNVPIIKINLGSYVSGTANTPDLATAQPVRLGRRSVTGLSASHTVGLEAYFSSSAPSSAVATAIATSIKSKLGVSAW